MAPMTSGIAITLVSVEDLFKNPKNITSKAESSDLAAPLIHFQKFFAIVECC